MDNLLLFGREIPVGGRLSLFLDFWRSINPSSWVLDIVAQGYYIPFKQLPRSRGIRVTPLSGDYAPVLLDEVDTLLQKGAIEPVLENPSEGFYSTYFLVPKKTGDLRPILNLKPLNGLVDSPTFKMETLESVAKGVLPGDWLASLDLKDAYFHVPIHPRHRKFLRFAIHHQCYQYKVLPFGLTTSPRVFTKVLAPLMGVLRLQGIQAFPYLDDILLTAESRQVLIDNIQVALSVLNQAGFIVNLKKSSLIPSQDSVFLGARIQSRLNLIALPLEKAQRLQALAQSFRLGKSYPARRWLVLLGVIASVLPMVKMSRLRMRFIQMHFLPRWNRSIQGLAFQVPVNHTVFQHLQWWTNLDNLLSGLPLSLPEHQVVLTTDASSLGWGGVLGEEKQGGSSC